MEKATGDHSRLEGNTSHVDNNGKISPDNASSPHIPQISIGSMMNKILNKAYWESSPQDDTVVKSSCITPSIASTKASSKVSSKRAKKKLSSYKFDGIFQIERKVVTVGSIVNQILENELMESSYHMKTHVKTPVKSLRNTSSVSTSRRKTSLDSTQVSRSRNRSSIKSHMSSHSVSSSNIPVWETSAGSSSANSSLKMNSEGSSFSDISEKFSANDTRFNQPDNSISSGTFMKNNLVSSSCSSVFEKSTATKVSQYGERSSVTVFNETRSVSTSMSPISMWPTNNSSGSPFMNTNSVTTPNSEISKKSTDTMLVSESGDKSLGHIFNETSSVPTSMSPISMWPTNNSSGSPFMNTDSVTSSNSKISKKSSDTMLVSESGDKSLGHIFNETRSVSTPMSTISMWPTNNSSGSPFMNTNSVTSSNSKIFKKSTDTMLVSESGDKSLGHIFNETRSVSTSMSPISMWPTNNSSGSPFMNTNSVITPNSKISKKSTDTMLVSESGDKSLGHIFNDTRSVSTPMSTISMWPTNNSSGSPFMNTNSVTSSNSKIFKKSTDTMLVSESGDKSLGHIFNETRSVSTSMSPISMWPTNNSSGSPFMNTNSASSVSSEVSKKSVDAKLVCESGDKSLGHIFNETRSVSTSMSPISMWPTNNSSGSPFINTNSVTSSNSKISKKSTDTMLVSKSGDKSLGHVCNETRSVSTSMSPISMWPTNNSSGSPFMNTNSETSSNSKISKKSTDTMLVSESGDKSLGHIFNETRSVPTSMSPISMWPTNNSSGSPFMNTNSETSSNCKISKKSTDTLLVSESGDKSLGHIFNETRSVLTSMSPISMWPTNNSSGSPFMNTNSVTSSNSIISKKSTDTMLVSESGDNSLGHTFNETRSVPTSISSISMWPTNNSSGSPFMNTNSASSVNREISKESTDTMLVSESGDKSLGHIFNETRSVPTSISPISMWPTNNSSGSPFMNTNSASSVSSEISKKSVDAKLVSESGDKSLGHVFNETRSVSTSMSPISMWPTNNSSGSPFMNTNSETSSNSKISKKLTDTMLVSESGDKSLGHIFNETRSVPTSMSPISMWPTNNSSGSPFINTNSVTSSNSKISKKSTDTMLVSESGDKSLGHIFNETRSVPTSMSPISMWPTNNSSGSPFMNTNSETSSNCKISKKSTDTLLVSESGDESLGHIFNETRSVLTSMSPISMWPTNNSSGSPFMNTNSVTSSNSIISKKSTDTMLVSESGDNSLGHTFNDTRSVPTSISSISMWPTNNSSGSPFMNTNSASSVNREISKESTDTMLESESGDKSLGHIFNETRSVSTCMSPISMWPTNNSSGSPFRLPSSVNSEISNKSADALLVGQSGDRSTVNVFNKTCSMSLPIRPINKSPARPLMNTNSLSSSITGDKILIGSRMDSVSTLNTSTRETSSYPKSMRSLLSGILDTSFIYTSVRGWSGCLALEESNMTGLKGCSNPFKTLENFPCSTIFARDSSHASFDDMNSERLSNTPIFDFEGWSNRSIVEKTANNSKHPKKSTESATLSDKNGILNRPQTMYCHDPMLVTMPDVIGPHNFCPSLPDDQAVSAVTKTSSYFDYSKILNCLFGPRNKVLMVQFSFDADKLDENDTYVRAMLVYSGVNSLRPVNRCLKHAIEDDPNSESHPGEECFCQQYGHVGHVVRSKSPDAIYCYDPCSKRHSVMCPVKHSSHILYHFSCTSSCEKGRGAIHRRMQIIFTLESGSGKVLGKTSFNIKICFKPKKEMEKAEKEAKVVAEGLPAQPTLNTPVPVHSSQDKESPSKVKRPIQLSKEVVKKMRLEMKDVRESLEVVERGCQNLSHLIGRTQNLESRAVKKS